MKYLITIVGPTAIGKTAMAIKLAQHYQCDIISADSRQFFKEMTIGTAVPSIDERASATHHFIHNKSVDDLYTVGDFEKEALDCIRTLHADSGYVILVGGSGLYIDAVLKGFDTFPTVDPSIREELSSTYNEHGIAYLQRELLRLDPEYFKIVDNGNPQRLMRALEICIGTGLPYSGYLSGKKHNRPFIPIVIGLEGDRMEMYARINNRVDEMVDQGLVEEVSSLSNKRGLNALQTVAYREIFEFLDGTITLAQAIEEIKKNTRRFAKRQMTWFRKSEEIKWFDYRIAPEELISHIDNTISYIQHSCR